MPLLMNANARDRFDPDAQAYINAVEAADGLPLEAEVKVAITRFVKGCKKDSTWDAIKACCILAGARTLYGALVPLIGPAPTSINFVPSDYSRTTGLKGDGLSKYLNSGYKISHKTTGEDLHLGLYGTESLNTYNSRPMGVFRTLVYTRHYLVVDNYKPSNVTGWGNNTTTVNNPSGYYVSTRVTGEVPVRYYNGSFNYTLNTDNSTPSDHPVGVFCCFGSEDGFSYQSTIPFALSNARIPIYHIGDGLSAAQVASLSNRINTMLNAFSSFIY